MRTGEGFELDLKPETPKRTPRLGKQLPVVHGVVADGQWHTQEEIAAEVLQLSGITMSLSSVASRLRDLRLPENGGHTIERRKVREGLFEYRYRENQEYRA